MRSLVLLSAICLCHYSWSQNVGVGETAPASKLEIKGDGNTSASSNFLIKNSDNNRLFHVNGLGSTTLGNVNFSNPGHILGIHNGLNAGKAHLGLYSTGALETDGGAINRLVFTNLTNGTRQFEIQSYTGTTTSAHKLSFKYFDFSSGATETNLLTFNATGTAVFSGAVNAASFSGAVNAASFNIATGGTQFDYLMKSSATGDVGFKKGTGALGMNYIICINGSFPTFGGSAATDQPMLAEVRLWAGVTPPSGWAFCQGQVLLISSNTALFSLIGTLYGGNGATTFALPDLRGAAPVQQGTPPAGRAWGQGERSF